MNNEKLLPCPFCGDPMKIETIADVATGPGEVFVLCDCGASSPGGGNLDEAIAAWNRRATPAAASAGEAGTIERLARNRNGFLVPDPSGDYVRYADHLRHVAAAVAEAEERAGRLDGKLRAVWANIELIITAHTGKPCEGEPLDQLANLLPRAATAPVSAVPVIPQSIQRAFVTLESNAGAYSIVMKFNQRHDAFEAHSFLLGMGGKDWPGSSAGAPVSAVPSAGADSGARMHDVVDDLRRLASSPVYSPNECADTMRAAANTIESLRAGFWNYAGIVATPPSAGAPVTCPGCNGMATYIGQHDGYDDADCHMCDGKGKVSAGAPVSAAELPAWKIGYEANPDAVHPSAAGRAKAREMLAAADGQELPALTRYGFDGTLGGDFGEEPDGPYVRLDDVQALLAMRQPQGADFPPGWDVRRDDDGVVVVQKLGIGGVVLDEPYQRENIAASIFAAFLGEMLSAVAAKQAGKEGS